MEMWKGVAKNIKKRLQDMDTYIYYNKQESESFEEFCEKCRNSMIIIFPEVFKKIYWEGNYSEKFVGEENGIFSFKK